MINYVLLLMNSSNLMALFVGVAFIFCLVVQVRRRDWFYLSESILLLYSDETAV